MFKNLLPLIRKSVADLNGPTDYSTKENRLALNDFSFEYIPVLKKITMPADRKMEYIVKLKNTGKKTWNKDTKINLIDNTLVKKSLRVKTSKISESQVAPGEVGKFKITIQSKLNEGAGYIKLRPNFNGENLSENAISIPVTVKKPHFDYKIVKISIPKTTLSFGESLNAIVTLKNTGNVKWRNYGPNRISIGSTNPKDRQSEFTNSSRMGFLKEPIVRPGQVGHFIFRLKAPPKSGKYTEYFAPVVESITWLDNKNMNFNLNII